MRAACIIADVTASAVGKAFNPDQFNNTEPRYLQEMAARFYRYRGRSIVKYGLKMHPWNDEIQRMYPWVSKL